ncbi:MAG: NAD+ synthase [Methanobacteriota archaeon]
MAGLLPRFHEDHVAIVRSFVAHVVEASGRRGVVLGLSGGVDSALVAKLCADAIGPKRVLAMGLPDGAGGKDQEDARAWAKALRVGFRVLDIKPVVAALERSLKASRAARTARGNLRARARMIALYYVANTEDRLVAGTGNKSELLCGYFTVFGDGACDFLPIGDLYKTQVRAMARHLGVPEAILGKRPTAGLWAGQTDESELGITYDDLDRILLGLELQLEPDAIAEKASVPIETVRHVERLVASSVHKRKMPLIPKLGVRTIGLDWRE